ncbi:helicase-like transcription factor CHR28 [Ziziphus jujuba]|uniref:Helicase-like transcription factor CHR28 n=1 Tax=Ziziphus jujuba TaxID=326968 RepID=A0ABM3IQI5_ZIZJJ|nr:helicase-like transcription factor CHR28 [Ziziphus jujuba]
MFDHVDPLTGLVDSARRCCGSVSGWISSLLWKNSGELIGSLLGNFLFEFTEDWENQHSSTMVVNDHIEIISSDSDVEIEDARDNIGSANHRTLPFWASVPETSSRNGGYAGRSYAYNGRTVNINGHTDGKLQNHFGPIDHVGPSSRHISRTDNSKYNGNVYQPQTVNSRIANSSETDYEKISSQQALKRTLPLTIAPSATSSKSHTSVDNIRRSLNWDTYGSSHNSAGPSSISGKSYIRDHSSRVNDNEVIKYENNMSRILPPSLMHGKSIPAAQFPTSSDPAYRSGITEENAAGSDERLIYQAALQDLNQPKFEANLPEGLLSVPLLRHQKIALAWMLQKETRSLHCLGGILADDQGLGKTISMIALIQMQKFLQSKSKSEDTSNRKTEALNLDDDDDNVPVVLDEVKKTEESDDVKPIPEVSTSTQTFSKRRPAAGTLVVCPASILQQWARELDDKVAEEAKLEVLIYHGGSRTRDPVSLAKYDVVLTTYAIVTNEVPKQPIVDEDEADEKGGEKYGISSEFSFNRKRKQTSNNTGKKRKRGRKGIDSSSIDSDCGPLARVGWFRVILDEAQTIKNHRTQVARACCSLRAKRRWCLSGTPIQNTIDDLYSYFRFLKYDPYAVYRSFYSTIKVPISRNSIQGYKKLQAVLRAIMLRRTKGTLIDGNPIISLPPKTIHLTRVDFTAEERSFYTQLESDSRSQFKAYAAAGTVNQNYANILLMLLRLRQACDHPILVKGYDSDFVGKDSVEMAMMLPKDMLVNLLNLLETSLAICRVCNDTPEDPVVTMCGHVFCYQCVSEYLTGDDNMCPVSECKQQVGSDVIFSKATLKRCIYNDPDDSPVKSQFADNALVRQNEYSSSKIRALLEILQAHHKLNNQNSELSIKMEYNGNMSPKLPNEQPIKAIVFSQWTSMLDLVEMSLNQSSIQYRRLDGTMTLASRDRAVKDFNTDPEVTVMVMSLKAGNLGLNMVAACHVILLDLWWNPTTEDQAVDRAHRIGQTRPVTVTRLTIKDTVEDRILALQEDKRKMVASAFGEDHTGGTGTRLTVEDLRYLFMV